MTLQGTQYALFEFAEVLPVEQVAPQSDTEKRFSDYVVYVDKRNA